MGSTVRGVVHRAGHSWRDHRPPLRCLSRAADVTRPTPPPWTTRIHPSSGLDGARKAGRIDAARRSFDALGHGGPTETGPQRSHETETPSAAKPDRRPGRHHLGAAPGPEITALLITAPASTTANHARQQRTTPAEKPPRTRRSRTALSTVIPSHGARRRPTPQDVSRIDEPSGMALAASRNVGQRKDASGSQVSNEVRGKLRQRDVPV
jgi:hypothetical protein